MIKVNELHIKYVTRVDKIGKADQPLRGLPNRGGFCLPTGLFEVRDDIDVTTFVFLNEIFAG